MQYEVGFEICDENGCMISVPQESPYWDYLANLLSFFPVVTYHKRTKRMVINRVQNKQIKDAIRKAGYDPNDPRVKDQINKMESYIRRHNLDYGWKKLLDFVKRWLG